jgi:POT family proton-dependent oligopeptide transporter
VNVGLADTPPAYYEILPAQPQAANPVLVLILIPVFSLWIYPLINKVFPLTPLRKIGIGLFVTVPAFALPAWIETRIAAGETPHLNWQLAAYLIMTSAEVMISITALEFSYTQAPKKMKSFIMGLYLLSVAVGNQFTVWINERIKAQKAQGNTFLEGPDYYWFFTGAILVTAVLYVVWSQFYKGETFIQDGEGVGESPKPPVDAEAKGRS